MFGLQQGNDVLKELHEEMTVENVEKLMGETADAVAYQQVRAALSLFPRRCLQLMIIYVCVFARCRR